MSTIVFATANPNKVREIQAQMGDKYKFQSLTDIGCTEDVPETRDTIIGNALQKAEYVHENYQVNCFAEDTGLMIDALNGAPGVYSARYAGPARDSKANVAKVLKELTGVENRAAHFKTVIALILDGETHTFEGVIHGKIIAAPRGTGGFGYDPIFQPNGYEQTFAEMASEEKYKISHRALATANFMAFMQARASDK